MRNLLDFVRLETGRRLVGLGFLIAPDTYWRTFCESCKDLQTAEKEK